MSSLMEEQVTKVKYCSLIMNTTPPDICTTLGAYTEDNKRISNIVVKFKFCQFLEVYEENNSPDPKDHGLYPREVDEDSLYEAALAFPLKPETVEYYLARAELDDDWPTADYVSPRIWNKVKKNVAQYILKKADFDSKIGFEMVASLDVSTVFASTRRCCMS